SSSFLLHCDRCHRDLHSFPTRRSSDLAKTWAGHLVHYGTGAVFGALYALCAPRHTRLWEGLLFGTAVWMFNDNLLVPAMRIADWPRRYPLGAHVKALVAHLVYGGGTALALRRSLKNRRLH